MKKGYIQCLNANGVTFNDGSYEDADIDLFSTGYRLDLNFLDKNVLETFFVRIFVRMQNIHTAINK